MAISKEGRIQADRRVTAFKKAASFYCTQKNMDPNRSLQLPHPTIAGVVVNVPLWYTVAEQMFDLALMLRAIRIQQDESEEPKAANDSKIVTS